MIWGLVNWLRIINANALLLLNHRHLSAGRRFVEVRKIDCHGWTCDVIDFDSQHTNASALISKGEIDALLSDGDALRLHIDVNIRVVIEATFTRSDTPDELVAFGLPWRRFARYSIELVE